MLYLDSSATLKLVREEEGSSALAAFLDRVDETLVTSRIGVIELRRVARRGGANPDRADALASALGIIEVDLAVEAIAVSLAAELRALDAVHLASAIAVRDDGLRGFVCYDRRLATAAGREELTVVAPGSP